ncbi:T9SS type A sorting domain-containing protein [candidate division KSB1 bacterium]|nr:T9SS type A sorting domain-containing protein [candidate division KSB1 bacterium]
MSRLVILRGRVVSAVGIIAFVAGSGYAHTLRVPSEFATIQEAFVALTDRDTVLVETGTYAEALVAPPLQFVLCGQVDPDTGEYPRPVIDPSALSGSDTVACLYLPAGSQVSILDFRFVNRRQMYPRRIGMLCPGGIAYATGEPIVARRCIFDSTYGGIDYTTPNLHTPVTIAHCVFRNVTNGCAVAQGRLQATDCRVEGHCVGGMRGLDSSFIENCSFSGLTELGWVGLYRSENVLRNCSFGPGTCLQSPVHVYTLGRTVVENCGFNGLGIAGPSFEIVARTAALIAVQSNHWRHNFVSQGSAIPITITDEVEASNPRVLFENNSMDSCEGALPGATDVKGLHLYTLHTSVELRRNRFSAISPASAAVVAVDTLGNLHLLRENTFCMNSYAVFAAHESLDATLNYWGDATGPYNLSENPAGLGDEVRGNVSFDPWYPDTSFRDAGEPDIPLPRASSLLVFPNPFNSETRIRFSAPEADIYQIEIFDLLGRRIADVFHGPVIHTRDISFNAGQLSSGIYFLRAKHAVQNRPLLTQKLVLLK